MLPPGLTNQSRMSRASANLILQEAAKVLAWELFTVAGCGRTRAFVNIEKFERALLSATHQWKTAHANLGQKKEKKWKNQIAVIRFGGRGTSTS